MPAPDDDPRFPSDVVWGAPGAVLLRGDCREVMATMPDASVDAVVCDPPYGLSEQPDMADVLRHWLAGDDYHTDGRGFMGKEWDGFVPGPATWREALRVLRPGGHLVAFAGSRTVDLMGVSLRLAGFEVRDTAVWLHGQGMPHSQDVGKAIDKRIGRLEAPGSVVELKRMLRRRFEESGKTLSQIDAECGFRAANYLTVPGPGKRPDPWAGVLPSPEKWERIKQVVGCADGDVDRALDEAFRQAERDVVARVTKARTAASGFALPGEGSETEYRTWDVTSPGSDLARRWSGWGTNLKPAQEPIVLARKPLAVDGRKATVAENVVEHGTGALNVDACRVPAGEGDRFGGGAKASSTGLANVEFVAGYEPGDGWVPGSDLGRWPANVLLVHGEGCGEQHAAVEPESLLDLLDGPEAVSEWVCAPGCPVAVLDGQADDPKGASRFFYRAKPSKAERNAGLPPGERNDHVTVKPVDVMRWLVRLVCPPDGTVLDPFMGSGTTGVAAAAEGMDFVGVEQDGRYFRVAGWRIRAAYRSP